MCRGEQDLEFWGYRTSPHMKSHYVLLMWPHKGRQHITITKCFLEHLLARRERAATYFNLRTAKPQELQLRRIGLYSKTPPHTTNPGASCLQSLVTSFCSPPVWANVLRGARLLEHKNTAAGGSPRQPAETGDIIL